MCYNQALGKENHLLLQGAKGHPYKGPKKWPSPKGPPTHLPTAREKYYAIPVYIRPYNAILTPARPYNAIPVHGWVVYPTYSDRRIYLGITQLRCWPPARAHQVCLGIAQPRQVSSAALVMATWPARPRQVSLAASITSSWLARPSQVFLSHPNQPAWLHALEYIWSPTALPYPATPQSQRTAHARTPSITPQVLVV